MRTSGGKPAAREALVHVPSTFPRRARRRSPALHDVPQIIRMSDGGGTLAEPWVFPSLHTPYYYGWFQDLSIGMENPRSQNLRR